MILEAGRLRWMCRRGMLELDVIFERFLDRHGFEKLSAADQALFLDLLEQPDPVLYSWLLGYEPVEEKYVDLVACINALSAAT